MLLSTTRFQRSWPLGLLLGLAAGTAHAQLVSFPGAEGYGRFASGGRGGQVVEVTNLNDSGTGSFRDAFNQYPGQPITIVFRVGGLISLNSALRPTRSDVTIAGQTAPGGGICMKNYTFKLFGNNIIVRYVRSRPGDTSGANVSGVYGMNMENCRNFIVDHCSMSWSIEEAATFYDDKYSTVQWCLVSESLNSSFNGKGDHGYAGVWGGQYASYHHNLIAHHHSRAIRFNGSRAHDTTAVVDYRNNVIYNWGNTNAAYGNEIEVNGGSGQLNMVNNYYKGGPATPASRASVIFDITEAYNAATPNKPVATVYASGNSTEGYPGVLTDNWTGIRLHNYPNTPANVALFKQLAPTPNLAPVTTQTAQVAYDLVLAGAGAIVPQRDPLDTRIVNETRTGTATGGSPAGSTTYGVGQGIIDTQTEVGGWPTYAAGTAPTDTDHDGMPDAWETSHSLNLNDPADRNGIGASGYTNLEEYLNSLALTTVLAAKTGAASLALQAYPNPAHDRLTVAHPAAPAGTTLAVYSYLGQRVAALPVAVGATSTPLPLQQLPTGNYLIFYADPQQQFTTRFTKE
ncbi:MAG: T9SS type A sorting domain-containing protein [Janthinobacterium lividum]